MQDYRRLLVWQKSHQHVLNIRDAIHRFPRSGYSSLKEQLKRSCESIPFNIVEGCGARSRADFARFLDFSIKSTSETEYQLELAHSYGIMSHEDWTNLSSATIEIRRMLCGLRKKVLSNPDQGSSG